ncbi:MAG TPA: hypothetical protein VLM40_13115 [Gemmata sp.]|nr:hypothetical protein [Gemmata sp.]
MVGAVTGYLAATPSRRRRVLVFAFSVVLVAMVWIAYTPSQKHAPRSDHWCFLIDTMKLRSLPEFISGSYSYNRTRITSPGDTDLFRPVLFALLATEQWLFAGDLWIYQTIGMMLHCAVCLLLLGIFRQLAAFVPARAVDSEGEDPGWRQGAADWLPRALAAFFALNPAIQELVIWTHLHGYLLFLVLLFASLILLFRHVAGPSAGSVRSLSLWGAWLLALVAAFTYEMGQFYAVLAGLFLAAAAYPRAGLARGTFLFAMFAAIMPIYQGINHYDLEVHRGKYVPDNVHESIAEQMFTRATVKHSLHFAVYTGVQPFFPSLLQTSFSGGRLQIAESLWTQPLLKRSGPLAVVSALVLFLTASLAGIGLAAILWRGERLPILALCLLAGLFGVYAAMTVLGRMNLRPGPPMLMSNSYYTYTALALLLPLTFAAWQGVAHGTGTAASTARKTLVAGLVFLSFAGAEQVWQMNKGMAPEPIMKDMARPIHAIQLFVKQHVREPDFTIGIDYDASDDVPTAYHVKVTDAIFHRWLSPKPKYWIAIRDGKAVVLTGPPRVRGSFVEPKPPRKPIGRSRQQVGGLASRPGGGGDDVPD